MNTRGYAVSICGDENVSKNIMKNLPLVANKRGICSRNININAIWVWAENTVNSGVLLHLNHQTHRWFGEPPVPTVRWCTTPVNFPRLHMLCDCLWLKASIAYRTITHTNTHAHMTPAQTIHDHWLSIVLSHHILHLRSLSGGETNIHGVGKHRKASFMIAWINWTPRKLNYIIPLIFNWNLIHHIK